jgi:hypothetical protein
MALTPIITACLKGCGTIVIEDITGFYNATTNTGGWNNIATAFKTKIIFSIKIIHVPYCFLIMNKWEQQVLVML